MFASKLDLVGLAGRRSVLAGPTGLRRFRGSEFIREDCLADEKFLSNIQAPSRINSLPLSAHSHLEAGEAVEIDATRPRQRNSYQSNVMPCASGNSSE